MTKSEFKTTLQSVGKFTGSRKFKVNTLNGDYDYIINQKHLSLFKEIMWDYYMGYSDTIFSTYAYYIVMDNIKYNIITYPDNFDLSIIDEVNDEIMKSDINIQDKETRIALFERLVKTKYEKNIITKPPIGLTPKHIKDTERLTDICDAIVRYIDKKMKLPIEWIEEYNELIYKN